MKISTKLTNYLKNLTGIRVSPNSDIHQGVQALILGLLTSFGLSAIISGALFSDSAYAAYSASISRTSSGTIMLSDGSGSSIKPSSTGTLGTGSDTVSVSSNCTAGYNLYVSAISGGSTNLSTDGGADYIPSTTTATGSEAALTKDTWGVGKNGSTFSKLPAYSTDASTWTALYTETGDSSSTAKNYTVYYGANVSTAKTPGTYTGDVLYTVIMNSACEKWTLKFDDNGADVNNLTDQELDFDATIDLSTISSTDKIAKTGYTLTGWKDQNGNSYGTSGTVDVNKADAATVTLTAQWGINSHTVTITKGSNVSTVTASDGTTTKTDTALTADYNKTITIAATAFSTGYHFSGWTVTSGGVTLYSNSAMTTQSTTATPAYFRMPDTNVAITASVAANTYTIEYAAGSTGGTCSVSDTPATYDQDVKLSSTVCTKSGAEQKGWSTTNSASNTKTYGLGATLIKPNLTSTNGGSVTLYPYFESTIVYMQDWTGCTALATWKSTILRDSRDNNDYIIKKLKDGKCWMAQNLKLVDRKLTPSDSDVTSDFTLTASTDTTSTSTWCTANNATCLDKSLVYYVPAEASDSSKHSYYGAIYNWYAATAGSGTSTTKANTDASSSICPKGWHLPKGGADATTNEFSILREACDDCATSSVAYVDFSSVFELGGQISGSTSTYNIGKTGYYWSSTTGDSRTKVSHLAIFSGTRSVSVNNTSTTGDKAYGRSVRCVAN